MAPDFICPHRTWECRRTADKYDRKMNARLHQCALGFESARPRQSNVKHDATGCVGALVLKEFLR